jgi:hypothetical protein
MDEAPHEAIGFHLTQLLGEHLLGDGGDRALQIREAPHLAAEEMKQDHQFPAPLENPEHVLDAARSRRRRRIDLLTFR